jgi:hypothetical protein
MLRFRSSVRPYVPRGFTIDRETSGLTHFVPHGGQEGLLVMLARHRASLLATGDLRGAERVATDMLAVQEGGAE